MSNIKKDPFDPKNPDKATQNPFDVNRTSLTNDAKPASSLFKKPLEKPPVGAQDKSTLPSSRFGQSTQEPRKFGQTTNQITGQNEQKAQFTSRFTQPSTQKETSMFGQTGNQRQTRPGFEKTQQVTSTTPAPASPQRPSGNIFQRQESSLNLPSAPASSTVSSIKERLEALQKAQNEKSKPLEKTVPSPLAKGSFIKSKMADKKPATEGTSPFSMKKPVSQSGLLPSPRPSSVARPNESTSQGNIIGINDAEFVQLTEFLYDQAGIFLTENRKYLVENRLSSRIRALGLKSFSEYLNYLKFDSNKSVELNRFFESMTTNETSFYRNGPQLKVFQENVLATLCNQLKNNRQKKLRIWSAGCSSGEEPYTIAMILHEHLKGEINSWDIKITANDLSLAMLDIARQGLYSEYALRTTPPEIVNKYFAKKGNQYEVLPEVKRLVSFGQINFANKPQMAKVETSHIVFCRNVIIYFDNEMKTGVINSFYDNLISGGYLIIGHSESLHNISRSFVPKHYTNAIIYQKKD